MGFHDELTETCFLKLKLGLVENDRTRAINEWDAKRIVHLTYKHWCMLTRIHEKNGCQNRIFSTVYRMKRSVRGKIAYGAKTLDGTSISRTVYRKECRLEENIHPAKEREYDIRYSALFAEQWMLIRENMLKVQNMFRIYREYFKKSSLINECRGVFSAHSAE